MPIETIDTILDNSEEFWSIDVTDELVEAIRLAYLSGLQDAAFYIGELSGVQVGISFDLVDPKVLEFIDERAAEMVRHVNDGTKYYLRNMIHIGVEEGIPEQDLIDGILENLFQEGDFSEKRIRSICRFEIARAQSDGWLKQMEEVGLENVRWVTIGADACEVCKANEEMGPQPVGSMNFDNVFGEKCAGPPAHPNLCRCHLNAMPEEISGLGKDFGFYTGKSEVIEKGGPTSGHRGHKGIPGYRGGSQPSVGRSKRMVSDWGTLDEERFFEVPKEEVENAFLIPGARSEVHIRPEGKNSISIVCEWTDMKTGEYIGQAERNLNILSDGTREWYGTGLAFSSGYQNRGLATDFYKRQVALAKQAGYNKMNTFADVTIGRYAWAKKGYDYADPRGAELATRHFERWSRSAKLPIKELPIFKSALDVANYKIPGLTVTKGDLPGFKNGDVPIDMQMNIGKAFMLDQSKYGHGPWNAVLDLGGRK